MKFYLIYYKLRLECLFEKNVFKADEQHVQRGSRNCLSPLLTIQSFFFPKLVGLHGTVALL